MQVTFLASLPAFKGLHQHYLRALSHCFHTVNFDPREVVVRQGDVSDCMYVLKAGQVCILIDPSMTLAETNAAADSSSGSGEDKKSEAQRSSGGGASEVASAGDTIDTKKLVQVGMMSVSLVQRLVLASWQQASDAARGSSSFAFVCMGCMATSVCHASCGQPLLAFSVVNSKHGRSTHVFILWLKLRHRCCCRRFAC